MATRQNANSDSINDLNPATDRKVSANELRWLAEEADGKRGEDGDTPYQIVWKPFNGQWRLGLEPKGTVQDPENVVCDVNVFTPFQGDGLRHQMRVKLFDAKTGGESAILKRVKNGKDEFPDAIFLTQSAFDKFVIPYYTRFRTPHALMRMMRGYFRNPNVLCMEHFPPSDDEGFTVADEDASPALTNLVPVENISGDAGVSM